MAEVFSISGAADDGGMGFLPRRFRHRLAPPPPPPPGYGPPPPPPPPAYGSLAWRRWAAARRATRRAMMFGQFGAACPAGWTQTPKGNCGGPTPPAYRNPVATALQNALKALGKAVGGDTRLMSLSADGVIGPATTAAVNIALTTHIGAGQAPANLRTGALSVFDVANAAAQITTLAQNETVRRGGSLTPPRPSGGGAPAPYVPPVPAPGPDQADVTPGIPKTTWAIVGVVLLAAGAGAYFMLSGDGSGRQQTTYPVRAGRRYAVV
jgi:hypothetical protein